MTNATTVNSHQCPRSRKEYSTTEEQQTKYYTATAADEILPKSTVKQIAAMFNSKISQNEDGDKDGGMKSAGDPLVETKLQSSYPMPPTHHCMQSNQKTPIPTPRTKSKLKYEQNSNNASSMSDDGFAKLTVKRKVQLYNQYTNRIAKKNLKYLTNAGSKQAKAKKAEVQHEVVSEKQASVKHLLAKLEAGCDAPKRKQPTLALDRSGGENSSADTAAVKAKEFEDMMQSSRTVIYIERRSESLPRNKTDSEDDFKATVVVEPSANGTTDQVCCTLSFETEATSNSKQLPPQILLQTQTSSGRDQNSNIIYGQQQPDFTPNIDKAQLLEETMAKLQNQENIGSQTKGKEPMRFKTLESKPRRHKKKPAPPVPVNSSGKAQANDENELDVTALHKVSYYRAENSLFNWLSEKNPTVGETEKVETNSNSTANPALEDSGSSKENETITKPTPPRYRKKKPAPPIPVTTTTSTQSRVSNDKEPALSSLQKITSEESQADHAIVKSDKDFEFTKPLTPAHKTKVRRSLTWQMGESSEATTNTTDSDAELRSAETKNKVRFSQPPVNQINGKNIPNHSSSEDSDLLREVDSPRTVKLAYNLTPFSQKREPIINNSTSAFKCPTTQPERSINEMEFSGATTAATEQFDSFSDQGFDSGSNGHTHKKLLTPAAVSSSHKEAEYSACFSTPTKRQPSMQYPESLSHLQLYKPIRLPFQNRRTSLCGNESRRSSLVMQSQSTEDQPIKIPPCSANNKEQTTATNHTGKTSLFWIKCGYFSLAFDVFYNDANQLRGLFNTFTQKSFESKDLYFGIDNAIFCVRPAVGKENFSNCLPLSREYSHYWFSTGDLIMPFAGQRMSPDKVQNLFDILRISLEGTSDIRFGIDDIEFSNICEFRVESPKFSMESNYSMLVGLQSGGSNGLEGRSKYAWPHTKPLCSDLEQANNGIDNAVESNSVRFSISPFEDKQFDFAASSPTKSHPQPSVRNSEVFTAGYKNESLDYLFDSQIAELPPPVAVSVPANFLKINAHSERFGLLREKLSNHSSNLSNDASGAAIVLKRTPQYIQYLKRIVGKVIGRRRRYRSKSSVV